MFDRPSGKFAQAIGKWLNQETELAAPAERLAGPWRAPRITPSLGNLLLNVPAIAHKSLATVRDVLGDFNEAVAEVHGHPKHAFLGGAVEIIFVRGRACWILLRDGRDIPFGREALAKLGLKPCNPSTTEKGRMMRWSNLYRIPELAVFANGRGGVSHLWIDLGETGSLSAAGCESLRISYPLEIPPSHRHSSHQPTSPS